VSLLTPAPFGGSGSSLRMSDEPILTIRQFPERDAMSDNPRVTYADNIDPDTLEPTDHATGAVEQTGETTHEADDTENEPTGAVTSTFSEHPQTEGDGKVTVDKKVVTAPAKRAAKGGKQAETD
jgi:hypothetical protein